MSVTLVSLPSQFVPKPPSQARAPSRARAARMAAKVAVRVAKKVAESGKERGAAASMAAKVVEKVVERGKERAATEITEDIAITANRRTLWIRPPPQPAVFLVKCRLNWRQGSSFGNWHNLREAIRCLSPNFCEHDRIREMMYMLGRQIFSLKKQYNTSKAYAYLLDRTSYVVGAVIISNNTESRSNRHRCIMCIASLAT